MGGLLFSRWGAPCAGRSANLRPRRRARGGSAGVEWCSSRGHRPEGWGGHAPQRWNRRRARARSGGAGGPAHRGRAHRRAGPGPAAGPDDEVIALSGKLVFPGLGQRAPAAVREPRPRHAPSQAGGLPGRCSRRCAGATRTRWTWTPCRWRPRPGASRRSSAAPPPLRPAHLAQGDSGLAAARGRGLHEVGVRGVLSYAVTDRTGAMGREEGLEETVGLPAQGAGPLARAGGRGAALHAGQGRARGARAGGAAPPTRACTCRSPRTRWTRSCPWSASAPRR